MYAVLHKASRLAVEGTALMHVSGPDRAAMIRNSVHGVTDWLLCGSLTFRFELAFYTDTFGTFWLGPPSLDAASALLGDQP